jgi:hypothetical protein
VAADGLQAPGVVVSYTDDPDVQNGKKFLAKGMQIAAGVPLQVGEGAEGFRTFRLGLFRAGQAQRRSASDMFSPCAPMGGTTWAASAMSAVRSPSKRSAIWLMIGQTERRDTSVSGP